MTLQSIREAVPRIYLDQLKYLNVKIEKDDIKCCEH